MLGHVPERQAAETDNGRFSAECLGRPHGWIAQRRRYEQLTGPAGAGRLLLHPTDQDARAAALAVPQKSAEVWTVHHQGRPVVDIDGLPRSSHTRA